MDKSLSIELYKIHYAEKTEFLKLHQQSLKHYLAFSSAILALTIAGYIKIYNLGWLSTIIICGPIINIVVCVFAIQTCDQYYHVAAEALSVVIKIEGILKVRNFDWSSIAQESQLVFSEDKTLLPKNWEKNNQYKTSDEFIDDLKRLSVNKLAKRSFVILIIVNIFLSLIILLTPALG